MLHLGKYLFLASLPLCVVACSESSSDVSVSLSPIGGEYPTPITVSIKGTDRSTLYYRVLPTSQFLNDNSGTFIGEGGDSSYEYQKYSGPFEITETSRVDCYAVAEQKETRAGVETGKKQKVKSRVRSESYSISNESAGSSSSDNGSVSPIPGTAAPSAPWITINGGAITTTSNVFSISLAADNASEMYITNTPGCSVGGAWQAIASPVAWTGAQTQGLASVYAKFRNATGTTSCTSDSITIRYTPRLSQARDTLSATTVGSKSLFAGGIRNINGGEDSAVVDIYDSSNDSWTVAALSEAKSAMSATTAGNFAVFAGGAGDGLWSDTLEIFNGNTGEWTTSHFSRSRYWLATTSIGSKIFIAGGSGGTGTTSNSIDVYDTSTATWSVLNMSVPRSSFAAASVDGKAIFAGSSTYSTIIDIYNSTSGTWTTSTLSIGRSQLSSASVGNKVLFAGGESQSGPSNRVDIYDSITGTWSTASLSLARTYMAATVVGTKALFAGGYWWNDTSDMTADVVDIYDAVSNTWSTARLSSPRYRLAATTNGTKAIFAGGTTVTGVQSDAVDIYDAATDTWSTQLP